MEKIMTIPATDLPVGDLNGFKLIEMYLFEQGDDDGKIFTPTLLFATEKLAAAFKSQYEGFCELKKVPVLSDGKSFVLFTTTKTPVEVVNEEVMLSVIRVKALQKLKPEEKDLLDIEKCN